MRELYSVASYMNTMFDGDQMNTVSLKTVYLRRAYQMYDPRENLAVSKNDGLFDNNFNLIKDQMICVHTITNFTNKKHKMKVIQEPTKKLNKTNKPNKKKLQQKISSDIEEPKRTVLHLRKKRCK